MKIREYKLVNLRIIKDGDVIFEGKSEDLPEEMKELESKTTVLESGTVVVEVY